MAASMDTTMGARKVDRKVAQSGWTRVGAMDVSTAARKDMHLVGPSVVSKVWKMADLSADELVGEMVVLLASTMVVPSVA